MRAKKALQFPDIFSHSSSPTADYSSRKKIREKVVNRIRVYQQKRRISPTFILHFSVYPGVNNIFNEKEFKILELEKSFWPGLPVMPGNSSLFWKMYKHKTYFPCHEEDNYNGKIIKMVNTHVALTTTSCQALL